VRGKPKKHKKRRKHPDPQGKTFRRYRNVSGKKEKGSCGLGNEFRKKNRGSKLFGELSKGRAGVKIFAKIRIPGRSKKGRAKKRKKQRWGKGAKASAKVQIATVRGEGTSESRQG